MSNVEFFFDYRSPYSYLAHSQLVSFGADIVYRPFDIADLMKRVGNVPTSVVCAQKNRYVQKDLARWSTAYGVPLVRHPDGARIDARRLLRASLAAASLGLAGPAVAALYRARWVQPLPLDDAGQIAQVLSQAGLDASVIEPMIDDPAMDEALDRSTTLAEQRGVFGAPTMWIDGELYFGNDRLDFVQAHLGEAG